MTRVTQQCSDSGRPADSAVQSSRPSSSRTDDRQRFPSPGKPTLIVGAGDGGRFLAGQMIDNHGCGFLPVGFVDDSPIYQGAQIADLPVLGTTADLPDIVRREGVRTVVIAIPSASEVLIARIGQLGREANVRVLAMPPLGALLRGEVSATALQRIDIADVLGRPTVPPDVARCRQFIAGRRVLITGAAGSIGQEVTRQVAQLDPAQVIVLDVNETGLFDLQQEIIAATPTCDLRPVIASVTNHRRISALFALFQPEIVFHVAAFKHVHLMEEHPEEAVMVNVVGTAVVAGAAAEAGVDQFVLVSSDKAVNPTSVMGATKRVAELVVRAVARQTGLSACSVRFGNVLGSRGSVVPIFARQIAAGGPVTITDARMQRFFMTIPEAASLIIQAGAFGDRDAIYVLDMGEEVSIVQLAERMIRLSGHRIGDDIEIVFTGLRPGEKLREELSLQSELLQPTSHAKIQHLTESPRATTVGAGMIEQVSDLRLIALCGDRYAIRSRLFGIVAAADGDGATSAPALELVTLPESSPVPAELPLVIADPQIARPSFDPARGANWDAVVAGLVAVSSQESQ